MCNQLFDYCIYSDSSAWSDWLCIVWTVGRNPVAGGIQHGIGINPKRWYSNVCNACTGWRFRLFQWTNSGGNNGRIIRR